MTAEPEPRGAPAASAGSPGDLSFPAEFSLLAVYSLFLRLPLNGGRPVRAAAGGCAPVPSK